MTNPHTPERLPNESWEAYKIRKHNSKLVSKFVQAKGRVMVIEKLRRANSLQKKLKNATKDSFRDFVKGK